MYGLQDWAAVQRVYKKTQSIRGTARELAISRKRRREKIAIPTRFRLAEGEGDTAQELYARILPLW